MKSYATEDKNGPVVRGDTGPGGSSCVVMASQGFDGPVLRGDEIDGEIYALETMVNYVGSRVLTEHGDGVGWNESWGLQNGVLQSWLYELQTIIEI